MDAYNLILNNEPENSTPPPERKITLIIDLTYSTPEIGALDKSVIGDELATLSNKVLECNLADPEGQTGTIGTSQEITG